MKLQIGAPYWSDRPVILVAGGPSLSGFNFDRLVDLDAWLVGVNESIFYLPRCDCGVTVDRVFAEKRADLLKPKIAGGMEMIIATGMQVPSVRDKLDATFLVRKLTNKLSDRPNELITCGTSGYGALGVAYLKHAKRILLLGYDYHHSGSHHHPDYEWHRSRRADCWHFWAKFYDSTRAQLNAAKVEVFNGSSKSTITAFQRGTIEEGLKWVAATDTPVLGINRLMVSSGQPKSDNDRASGQAAVA